MTHIENTTEVSKETLGQKIKAMLGISSSQHHSQAQLKRSEALLSNQLKNKTFSFTPYLRMTKGTTYRLQPSKWRED